MLIIDGYFNLSLEEISEVLLEKRMITHVVYNEEIDEDLRNIFPSSIKQYNASFEITLTNGETAIINCDIRVYSDRKIVHIKHCGHDRFEFKEKTIKI